MLNFDRLTKEEIVTAREGAIYWERMLDMLLKRGIIGRKNDYLIPAEIYQAIERTNSKRRPIAQKDDEMHDTWG